MLVTHDVLVSAAHAAARVQARPHPPHADSPPRIGEYALSNVRIVVPSSYRAARPAGVLVILHGAGADATQALDILDPLASDANLIIVAPSSAGRTWDVLRDGFGPDVARIDHALADVFDTYAIDPARVAIGGFADGASYALTLGLANGELFSHVLAFSPGCEVAPRRQGTPRVFVSHGIEDRVLPIDRTSRRLVPALRARGLDVDYHELPGGHLVPPEVVKLALAHLAA